MPIVANSGPLIALARIGQLDLLPTLYGEVIVPSGVYQEITGEADLPGARELAQADWLSTANRKFVPNSVHVILRPKAEESRLTGQEQDPSPSASPEGTLVAG